MSYGIPVSNNSTELSGGRRKTDEQVPHAWETRCSYRLLQREGRRKEGAARGKRWLLSPYVPEVVSDLKYHRVRFIQGWVFVIFLSIKNEEGIYVSNVFFLSCRKGIKGYDDILKQEIKYKVEIYMFWVMIVSKLILHVHFSCLDFVKHETPLILNVSGERYCQREAKDGGRGRRGGRRRLMCELKKKKTESVFSLVNFEEIF